MTLVSSEVDNLPLGQCRSQMRWLNVAFPERQVKLEWDYAEYRCTLALINRNRVLVAQCWTTNLQIVFAATLRLIPSTVR